jgi:hypothetical protein
LHAEHKVKTCRQDAGVPTAPIARHWFRNAAFQAAGVAVAVAFEFAVAFAFAFAVAFAFAFAFAVAWVGQPLLAVRFSLPTLPRSRLS